MESIMIVLEEAIRRTAEARENLVRARSAYNKEIDSRGEYAADRSEARKNMAKAVSELKDAEGALESMLERLFLGDPELFENSMERPEARKDMILRACDKLDSAGFGVLHLAKSLATTKLIRGLVTA